MVPPTIDEIRSRDRQSPHVVSISLVKNEADIIEAFVRHNLQFVDTMFVVDNCSADRTREILLALQHEGLPIIVTDDPRQEYDQTGKMTRISRSVIQGFAPDYLCFLDADEFLVAPSRTAFKSELRQIPEAGQGLVTWRNYMPPPEPTQERNPLHGCRFRRAVETAEWNKAILAVPGVDLDRMVVMQGNHGVAYLGGGLPTPVKLPGISLAHIPVRSLQQLLAKIVVGRMAYFALTPETDRTPAGSHWDNIYRKFLEQDGLQQRDVVDIALNYSQAPDGVSFEEATIEDPLPCTFELRYTPPAESSALVTVARSWERQVRRRTTVRQILETKLSEKLAAVSHESEAAPDTAFSAEWHLETTFCDLPPFQFVFEKHEPKSVLDIGCGLGAYLVCAREHGAERVCGVDGIASGASLLEPGEYHAHDLATPLDLGRQFDLVMCMEVAEHLPADRAHVLLETLDRHARDVILFSAADVGQAGNGHINCRAIDYWLERWGEFGWEADGLESLAFRSLASFSWFRRNPLVLRRIGSGSGGARGPAWSLALLERGQQPWRWWDQPPGIVEHPFLEQIPHGFGPVVATPPVATSC